MEKLKVSVNFYYEDVNNIERSIGSLTLEHVNDEIIDYCITKIANELALLYKKVIITKKGEH